MGVLLALLTGCAAVRPPLTPGGPGQPTLEVDLRVLPSSAFAPALVVARLRVDGGEDAHCPGVRWDWDDGSVSAQEGDCAPEAGPHVFRDSRQHVYRQPGEFVVEALVGRGRLARAARQTVRILSREQEP